MKNLLLVGLALSVLLVAPVQANENMTVDQKLQKMQSNLNLTTDQSNSIRPVLQDYMNKKEALRATGNGDMTVISDQIEQLNKEKERKLGAILTPDQMNKMKTMKDHDWEKSSSRY